MGILEEGDEEDNVEGTGKDRWEGKQMLGE